MNNRNGNNDHMDIETNPTPMDVEVPARPLALDLPIGLLDLIDLGFPPINQVVANHIDNIAPNPNRRASPLIEHSQFRRRQTQRDQSPPRERYSPYSNHRSNRSRTRLG